MNDHLLRRLEALHGALMACHQGGHPLIGETLTRAFREGTDEERRGLLGRVYANFVVKDRKATPVLRSPFDLVAEVRDLTTLGPHGDANLPPAEDFLRQNARNARRGSSRDRALQAWSG